MISLNEKVKEIEDIINSIDFKNIPQKHLIPLSFFVQKIQQFLENVCFCDKDMLQKYLKYGKLILYNIKRRKFLWQTG